MTVVTVRSKADGSLVCFGPDNGQYEPRYDTATMVMAVEPEYTTVYAEWCRKPVVPTERMVAKESLRNASTINEVIVALETLLP